jgi:quercetin dioxygenase-like cupin family protein
MMRGGSAPIAASPQPKESPVRAAYVIAVALTLASAGAGGQQAGFKRTILQQVDLSTPGREVVTVVAEFAPGASTGWHTHAGEEVPYVLEGSVLLQQDGKPDMMLATGKAFVVPAGTVHNATNMGRTPARLVVSYVVEKGKPLAQPVAHK